MTNTINNVLNKYHNVISSSLKYNFFELEFIDTDGSILLNFVFNIRIFNITILKIIQKI